MYNLRKNNIFRYRLNTQWIVLEIHTLFKFVLILNNKLLFIFSNNVYHGPGQHFLQIWQGVDSQTKLWTKVASPKNTFLEDEVRKVVNFIQFCTCLFHKQ